MTTSKNEEEILREFENMEMTIPDDELEGCLVYREITKGMLRSALASYLMHLKGEMPVKREIHQSYHRDGSLQPGNELSSVCVHCMQRRWAEEQGYNSAIDQVHILLDEKIRKLTE